MQKSLLKHVSFPSSALLFLLTCFVVVTRLPQLMTGAVAFGFDHGRDALAILHMVKTFNPTLIGPWTSIPGLFFGPMWYYLLAPIFAITQGNPVAPTAAMVLLIVLEVALTWKFFGKLSALIIACAPLWMIISTSAWNPYPMPLLSLIILIMFQRAVENTHTLSLKQAIAMGLAAGFGFHFSTAYAVFYPLIIAITLLLKRISLSKKSIAVGIIAFLIPFVPQLLFEVKYQFQEVRAVARYITEGRKADAADATKIDAVLRVTLNEVKLAVFPEIWLNNQTHQQYLTLFSTFLLITGVLIAIKKKSPPRELIEIVVFFVVPLIGFTFLHFNLWYLLGLMPAAVLFVSFAIKKLPKPIQLLYIVLLICTPVSLMLRFWSELPTQNTNVSLLPVKLQAISEVRRRANNQPFASYHYEPDIYDFPYQYIYIWQAFQGQMLPTEFSYKPGESLYIPQKPQLLELLKNRLPTNPPKKVFFIVEKGGSEAFLQSWWQQQQYGEIIDTIDIGPNLQVFEATPKL